MNLFIVGNVDPAETMEWIADNQKQKHFNQVTIPEVQFELNDETGQDVIPFRTLEMDVTRPKVMVGVRGLEPISAGQAGLKYRLGVELLLDILFDDTVDNYLRLYNNGIIDDSFSYNFEMQRGFHFAYFSSDTDHIERFADEIIGILESAQQQIEAAASQFNNIKRAVLGRMIALLDSPEAIANRYADKLFGATNLLDEITVLESITIEDLYVIAREFIQSQGISVYQIVPRHSN